MRRGRSILEWVVMLIGAGAQAAAPAVADQINVDELLKQLQFLLDGKTERTEVVARLGAPEATYVSGLVASYSVELLYANDTLFVCPCPPADVKAKFQLTLEFSPGGILQRHALVNRN